LLYAIKSRAAPADTDSLLCQFGECRPEVSQEGLAKLENVDVEMELVPRRECMAVKMSGAQDKGARPIDQPAGDVLARWRDRLEQTLVGCRGSGVAQHHSKRAADHVPALRRRELHLIKGTKMKSKSVELEGVHEDLLRGLEALLRGSRQMLTIPHLPLPALLPADV